MQVGRVDILDGEIETASASSECYLTRLQNALRRLLECPDLNLDELEEETIEAIDEARELVGY